MTRIAPNIQTQDTRDKTKEPNPCLLRIWLFRLLRRRDSNARPLGYEPNELPTAPLRDFFLTAKVGILAVSAKGLINILTTFNLISSPSHVTAHGIARWSKKHSMQTAKTLHGKCKNIVCYTWNHTMFLQPSSDAIAMAGGQWRRAQRLRGGQSPARDARHSTP